MLYSFVLSSNNFSVFEEKKMGGNSPCASCKLLRRRCAKDCTFAPYFPSHEPQKFAIVHKVFGASNVSKMLQVPRTLFFFVLFYFIYFACKNNLNQSCAWSNKPRLVLHFCKLNSLWIKCLTLKKQKQESKDLFRHILGSCSKTSSNKETEK